MYRFENLRQLLSVFAALLLSCVASGASAGPGTEHLQRLGDLNPGPDGSDPANYLSCDGADAYFSARSTGNTLQWELWRTDGTPAGTVQLTEPSSRILPLACFPGRSGLFALRRDDPFGPYRLLWVDTLSGEAIELAKDIQGLFEVPSQRRGEVGFLENSGLAYFTFDNRSSPIKVVVSDGTPEGTQLLAGLPDFVVAVNRYEEFQGAMYFRVVSYEGEGLWMTEGTVAHPVDEVVRWSDLESTPKGLIGTGLSPEHGYSLWVIDRAGAPPRRLATVGGLARHHSTLSDGRSLLEVMIASELWITDGTKPGTRYLKTLEATPVLYQIHLGRNVVELGEHIYFLADDGVEGWEIWRTDGTLEGTQLAIETCEGSCSNVGPGGIHQLDQYLAFTVRDAERETRLALSDGTWSGTRFLNLCSESCRIEELRWHANGGRSFAWVATEQKDPAQIYQYDPGSETVKRLTRSSPEIPRYQYLPGRFTFVGGGIVTTAADSEAGEEPWVIRPHQPPVTEVPAMGFPALVGLVAVLASLGVLLLGGGRLF